MKVLVRFENDKGYLSMVGMNNLIIIDDKRIKSISGLNKRITDLVKTYHPYRRMRKFHVFDYKTEKLLFVNMVN